MTRRTLIASMVVFVIVTAIDATVLWRTRDRHLGVHEDHFDKGVSLYETGSMSSGSKPSLFRPPGYPAFVAVTLAFSDAAAGIARPLAGNVRTGGGRRVTVLAAHAALLGVLGAVIFWFALNRTGTGVASACAVSVACNPLLLIIAGHVSYPLLHIVLLTIATLMLLKRIGGSPPERMATFGNGLVWGAATLVKSVTLIAPAFILLWASLYWGLRKAVTTSVFFTAGLLLVVMPYTARNYGVSGRFIPVNAQASYALWATSHERIPEGENYLHWVKAWAASGMNTYTEITGRTDYSAVVFEDYVLELGDRFRAMAIDNLRRDPTVYAYNAFHNSVMFIVDPPTSYWFDSYAFLSPSNARALGFVAGLSVGLMTLISVLAIVIGCIRRDPSWTLLLALFAMMWAAHAMTFLEERYLYIKVPTIVAGFVLAIVASADGQSRWRRSAVGAARLAAVLSMVGLFTL